MVFSTVILLMQFRDAFTSAHSELEAFERSSRVSQELTTFFEEEYKALQQYFLSSNQRDYQNYEEHHKKFEEYLDTLVMIYKGDELLNYFNQAQELYLDYYITAKELMNKLRDGTQIESHVGFNKLQSDVEKLRNIFKQVSRTNQYSLNKAVRLFKERTDIAIRGTFITLFLSLVVVIGTGIVLARTLTRPIDALKAGTERVGEGHYETISVTSNDEIADLTNAFNLMSERLKKLDQMRMELMSEISHEMRTPLQVIKAGCYSIVHAKDSPKLTQRQMDAIGMIHQAANRINSFVNHFLDIAKLEAGLMKFNFELAELAQILTPIVQEAELVGQTRQIKVTLHTDDHYKIVLDKERMSQVFSNLLSNALKYTPQNGTIDVRVSQFYENLEGGKNNRAMVRIDVQDSGVGIPPEDLDKLFNKFFQAHNTPIVKEKGSGLGLALVKYVTEAHGGRVLVSSKVGVGSTFSVLLPLTKDNPSSNEW